MSVMRSAGNATRWIQAGLATILFLGCVGLILASCSHEDVPVVEVWGNASEARLDVTVDSCNKNPTVEVRESAEEVHLRAQARTRLGFYSGDCLDGVSVELERSLGERTVVDDATKMVVTVQPRE